GRGASSTMNTTRSGRPLPVTSATATPAPWFSNENQSGTSSQGVQPPVTAPVASRSRPTRYRPRFRPGGASTMSTTRSGRPLPVTSATAAPAPWFSNENQSGTSSQGVQPPVTTPVASRSRPTRYRPRFWPGGASTMSTTRSGRPLPVTSATARPAPWFSNENQSGMVRNPGGAM